MGKIVKTVLKIAAVAAIAVFAPPVAAAIAGSVGVSGAIGTTLIAAGVGAGAGELAGVGWQAGLMAGGLSGANSSGLFGGGGAAGSTAGSTAGGTAGGAAGAPSTAFTEAFSPEYMSSLGGGTAAAAPTAAAAAAPTAAAAAPATLGSTLSKFASNPLGTLGGGIKSMTTGLGGALGGLSSATGLNLSAVAPNLLAAGLVGNPGGALAKAQEAELMRAQQVNAALTQQRLDQANQLFREGEYSDPEFMGRQSAEAAMIKGGIETKEATRGLTGERLAAERRRMRLGTARNAGTAYQQGYRSGVGERLSTRQAGISAMPTQYPMTDSASAINASNEANRQRAAQEAGLSKMFGQVLGQRPTLAQMTPDAAYAISQNPDIF